MRLLTITALACLGALAARPVAAQTAPSAAGAPTLVAGLPAAAATVLAEEQRGRAAATRRAAHSSFRQRAARMSHAGATPRRTSA